LKYFEALTAGIDKSISEEYNWVIQGHIPHELGG